MKEWYTASEIAALGLAELPATERALQLRAEREQWECRRRKGRGGGREYSIHSLPTAAREQLSRQSLATPGTITLGAEEPALQSGLKPWQKRVQEARAVLLQEIERQALVRGQGITEAEQFLASLAQDGELPPELAKAATEANNRRGSRRGLTARSLSEWRRAHMKGGFAALAPEPAKKQRQSVPAWLHPFLELYQRPGKPSIAQCHELLLMERPDLAVPNLRTVQREVQALGAVFKNRGRMGPREMKSLRAYVVRDFSGLEPMDVISADGHTHDQEVQHPQHGRPFRPEIVANIDIATRRCVGWSAGLAESAFVVADALRMTAATAGIAGIYYVDNGRGFKNELLDEAALGMLARLGTTKMHSLPYNSQARGVIERFNATCWVRSARMQASYVGRDMDREARQIVYKSSRAEIEQVGGSRFILPWDDFMAWAQAQVDAYNARPHSSLPKIFDAATGKRRHQSPDEAWQGWVDAGWEPVAVSGGELDDLFRPYVLRKVNRGQVTLGTKSYFSRDLDLGDWHGDEVLVGYDIHDPARVWVRDLDERLICIAELDGNKAPYIPLSAVEEAKERRAKAREKRLERRLAEVAAERGVNIIEIAAPPSSEADDAATEALEAEILQIGQAAPDEWDQKRARIDRALTIERRLERDLPVSESDRAWFQRYRDHPEFKAHKAVFEEFGT